MFGQANLSTEDYFVAFKRHLIVRIAFPEYWLWWLGLPVSLGVIYLVYKRVSHMIRSWFSKEQYDRNHPFTKMLIRMVGFTLLFVALLGVYFPQEEQNVPRVGRDVMFLLDVSSSMNARDLRPSRLEKSRRELRRLIGKLEGDRVGIIAFTDVGFVQCPLTEDLAAALTYLDLLATNQFAQTGTQFRSALTVALDRFRSQEEQNLGRRARIIVLISDGEDHGDTYTSLVNRLKQSGVVLFPVGVGTYNGAPVPLDADDLRSGYVRNESDAMVISRLEDESLEDLASEFNTTMMTMTDDRDHLDQLEEQLYSMSASPLERNLQAVAGNQFQVPLFISFVLLLGSMFLMPIRKE